MNIDLIIDESKYELKKCSFEDLQLAVTNLAHSTEEQFNDIKNEKWFTRVFDLITLSNKKEIRIASQIQNVVQAQEILIQLLVRLSRRDQSLNTLVEQAFANIEKLSQQDLKLAEKLKNLQIQYTYGIEQSVGLDDLSDVERQIVGALLLELSKCFDQLLYEQQLYANSILIYLNVVENELKLKHALEKINNLQHKKFIFQLGLEYIFLNDYSLQMNAEVTSLMEEFDFGKKTIDGIKNKVASIYKLRGIEGFLNRLNIEIIEDVFTMEFDELPFIEEQRNEQIETEKVIYDKLLNVVKNEHLQIENKEVTIDAFFNVEGKVTFKNCVIHYALEETAKAITLKENAILSFENCDIIGHQQIKNYFIKCEAQSEVYFNYCKFEQCGVFISLMDYCKVLVENSYLHNCQRDFIDSNHGNETIVKIDNCEIEYTKISKNNKLMQDVFQLSNGELIIINSEVKSKEDFYNAQKQYYQKQKESSLFEIGGLFGESGLFNANKINIQCTRFENMFQLFSTSGGINEVLIEECTFNNCMQIIMACKLFKTSVKIHNSLIEYSENLFVKGKYTITQTVIKDCSGQLLDGEIKEITLCEFYNIANKENNDVFAVDVMDYYDTGIINKCIFNGVDLHMGFLIAGNTSEKLKKEKIIVNECEFKNCRTNRKTGKILKEYAQFKGFLGRIVETKILQIGRNCIGLDTVNMGVNCAEVDFIKGSMVNKVVKAGLVPLVFVSPLSAVVGYGVSKLLEDDKVTEE